jgi:hypothetical protein
MDTFGSTFQPNSNDDPMQRQQQSDPVQQAIQILALRLPKFVGAGVSPTELLSPGGGAGLAGLGNGDMVGSIISGLLGANRPRRPGAGAGAGAGAPAPPAPSGQGSFQKPRIHAQEAPAPPPPAYTPQQPTGGPPAGYRPNVGGYGQSNYSMGGPRTPYDF